MTSTNIPILSSICACVIVIYMLGFAIYSGYTAGHNQPDDNSKGLFIASYVICTIQCIIYLIGLCCVDWMAQKEI
jgi:hypothetical protein